MKSFLYFIKMKYQATALVTAITALAAIDATFALDKAAYAKNIAPSQLDRLSKYRTDNANKLSESQIAVVETAEAIVRDFAIDKIPALETACNAVFSHEECRIIFVGEGINIHHQRDLFTRRQACECSLQKDWCAWGSDCWSGTGCGYASKLVLDYWAAALQYGCVVG